MTQSSDPFPAAAAVSYAPPVWRARPVAPPRRHPLLTLARTGGATLSTIVLLCAVIVALVQISYLTEAGSSPQTSVTAIFGAIGVGLVFGMMLMYFSARTYAKVMFAILAVVLMTAGFVMLVLAPVLRQMNTPQLAEYRAFKSLLAFGILTAAAGIALAALCLYWAAQPTAHRRLRRWSRLLGSAYGVMLGISGVIGIFSLLRLIDAQGTTDISVVERSISIAVFAAWSFVPGIILTYHGISASMGEGSSEARLPPAAWGVALFAGVLVLGGVIMRSGSPVAAPMPLLHVLAAAVPGITLVAMASRGTWRRGVPVRGLSWRQLTLAAAISMTVGTTLALYVEGIGGFGSVMVLLVHNGAFDRVRDLDEFGNAIRDSNFILSRNEQFAANLITASLLAPVIEEFGKGLGVRFMLRSTTTRAQAFVMGAAAGAGFGFLEAMGYGLAGIQHGNASYWWTIMAVRGGSTSLHVFNTAIVGLAWWYAVVPRRWRTALLLFGAAVFSHALWNGIAVTVESRIFGLDTLSGRTLEIIAYTSIGVIAAVYVLGVPFIAARLREPGPPPPPPVEGTPLASMSAWLG